MAFYLGIDGGGTRTTCAVGDDNAVLGTATSGASNIIKLGERQARTSLQDAILKACDAAGISSLQLLHTCVGVAGASVPEVREALRRFIAEIAAGSILILGDHEIALEAAFGGGPGVIVISGTGSIACGRNEKGEIARAGGHGFAISDEGSGYWIGRAAVSAALRAIDSGAESILPDRIGTILRARNRDELVRTVNGNPVPDFSQLFPCVAEAAQTGDVVAASVLRSAGAELAQLAAVVSEKLWPRGGAVHIAMAGGVFQNSAMVREAFSDALHSAQPQVSIISSVVTPVMGALSLARSGVRQGAAH